MLRVFLSGMIVALAGDVCTALQLGSRPPALPIGYSFDGVHRVCSAISPWFHWISAFITATTK